MRKPNTADDIVPMADLQQTHRRVKEAGIFAGHNLLAEREAALAAYVIHSAYHIGEGLRYRELTPEFLNTVQVEIGIRMLVVIEALQQAHYALWRDLMGDPDDESDPPPTTEQETDNG